VDNLPVMLLHEFLALCERASGEAVQKIALVIDIREGEFLRGAADAVRQLRAAGYPVEVLFLEADDGGLGRRSQGARRRHPAASGDETLRASILREREQLAPLRDLAEGILNTSDLNVHQLRRAIRERYSRGGEGERLGVCFL